MWRHEERGRTAARETRGLRLSCNGKNDLFQIHLSGFDNRPEVLYPAMPHNSIQNCGKEPENSKRILKKTTSAKFADVVLIAIIKTEDGLLSLLIAHFGKALAAVHGTVRLGLERNLRLAAAGCANSGEILAGAAGGVLASIPAGLAALRLVLEAALCIELLLTGGEHELLAALFAH